MVPLFCTVAEMIRLVTPSVQTMLCFVFDVFVARIVYGLVVKKTVMLSIVLCC